MITPRVDAAGDSTTTNRIPLVDHHPRHAYVPSSMRSLLIVDDDLLPGNSFLLKLKFDRTAVISYTVKHCTKLAPDGYRISAELDGAVDAPWARQISADMIYAALLRTGDDV
jgi:hypothetical protein